MNKKVSNNYYYRLDEEGRLTLELTEDKTLEECMKLTMQTINELNSQVADDGHAGFAGKNDVNR